MAYCSQAHRLWASSFAIPVIRSMAYCSQAHSMWASSSSGHQLLAFWSSGSMAYCSQAHGQLLVLELRISMAGRFLGMMGIRLLGALNSTATPYLQHTVYGVLQSGCGRVSVFWASTPCLLEPYDSSAKRSVALYYSSAKRSVAYCSQVLRLWASSFSWTNSLPF